jgi:hypothetical protein
MTLSARRRYGPPMDTPVGMATSVGTVFSFPSDIDPIQPAEIQQLLDAQGPRVTIQFPTHRHGPEVRQGPIRLRNLIDTARSTLNEQAVSSEVIDEIMSPVEALVGDDAFWQHQGSALSICAAPGTSIVHRLPVEIPETVMVADTFHLTPLVSLLSGNGHFLVLVVSQNLVKVYGADRWHMWEIDTSHAPDAIPSSMKEALAHEDPERQLQQRSSGTGEAQFHGHGSGDELDKAAIERFLRAVDHGMAEVLAGVPGATDLPLVVASVAYYQPIYRGVSRHRVVMERGIEGNPDHLSPADLHASAWAVVSDRFDQAASTALERFAAARGTGDAESDPFEIAARAAEGRVDTLIVNPAGEFTARAMVDAAILETLRHSGRIIAAEIPGSVGALLRY